MCQEDYLTFCEEQTFERLSPEQRVDWYRLTHGYPRLYNREEVPL